MFVGSSYRQNRWLNYWAYKFCIFQLRMHRHLLYTLAALINHVSFGHGPHDSDRCFLFSCFPTQNLQSDNVLIMNAYWTHEGYKKKQNALIMRQKIVDVWNSCIDSIDNKNKEKIRTKSMKRRKKNYVNDQKVLKHSKYYISRDNHYHVG